MLCVLAVFVPSFFMTGVSRQLFVPLSLAVAFSMIASYVLSSTLVPVFSTWLLKEARGDLKEGAFASLRSLYSRYLDFVLRFRWPVTLVYLIASVGFIYILGPRMGTEIFPKSKASILRVRLRAPSGTRVEETERIVLRALNVIQREAGADKVEITSDFVGVVPSSYPVDLIHLFTSGPQEAIIQVALNSKAGKDEIRGDLLQERLRKSLPSELPACQFSFEPGDIVGQVMSFGSATPVEIAVLASSLTDASTIRAEDPGAACAASVLEGSAIRSGSQLSDARHQYQPGSGGAVRLDDGRRSPVGGSGDVVVAIHATELLARSELR